MVGRAERARALVVRARRGDRARGTLSGRACDARPRRRGADGRRQAVRTAGRGARRRRMTVAETARYRLELARDGTIARLESTDGRYLASLRLLAALDCTDGTDETLATETRVRDRAIEVERQSTRWDRAFVTLVCEDDVLELRTAVTGRGRLTDVHLLAGRSLLPGAPTGFVPSGSGFRTLFTPNPGDPRRVTQSAAETATIGVVGDSEPGRGHWFFTPAPLYLALSTDEQSWLSIALAARVDQLAFTQLAYQPGDRAFSLRLEYDAHT